MAIDKEWHVYKGGRFLRIRQSLPTRGWDLKHSLANAGHASGFWSAVHPQYIKANHPILDYSKFAFTMPGMMRKSTHTREYAIFLELLIEARRRAGLTQAQIGENLPFEQPGISKIERGERRLDVIELKMVCESCGIKLTSSFLNLKSGWQRNMADKLSPDEAMRMLTRRYKADPEVLIAVLCPLLIPIHTLDKKLS